jgi:hypothetical protein
MGADISIADALRTAEALSPLDAPARRQLLDMLGLTTVTTTPAVSAIGVWQPSSTDTPTHPSPTPRTVQPPVPIAPRQDPSPSREPGKQRRTVVTRVKEDEPSPAWPAWLLADGDRLEPARVETIAAPPNPLLFSRLKERAILTAALSTVAYDGDIDANGVAAIIATGRPLIRVPRIAIATLRRGVQVLVDTSAALDPYRSDADQLLRSLDALLADDRLQIMTFRGCPQRGVVPNGADAEQSWPLPPAGTLVVVVGDFGIGGPLIDDDRASATEWLAFIHAVRSAGNPLLGFVPYEARRWPPVIARSMTLIHWSERTTVGEIRRAIREAYRR